MTNLNLNSGALSWKPEQDFHTDQKTALERLRELVNKRSNPEVDVREYYGIVLKTRWVSHADDGFGDNVSHLLKDGSGYVKCLVRIPEFHACIPEPKNQTNDPEKPNFDDLYVHMHDEFYVMGSSIKAAPSVPSPRRRLT